MSVAYIAVSSTLADTATYPIPADMESIIVKNLVETINLLKAAEEDFKNNNLG